MLLCLWRWLHAQYAKQAKPLVIERVWFVVGETSCSYAHKYSFPCSYTWCDSLFESLHRFRVGIGKLRPVVSCWFQSWKVHLHCPVTYMETHFEHSCSSHSMLAACWRRAVSICLMVRNIPQPALGTFLQGELSLGCVASIKNHTYNMFTGCIRCLPLHSLPSTVKDTAHSAWWGEDEEESCTSGQLTHTTASCW